MSQDDQKSPDRLSQIDSIAAQEGISLYQRFTESAAADILQVSAQTLRRMRGSGKIAYIRVSERNIRYFGLHLCEYILSKVENVICPDTTSSDSNSVSTGSASSPAARPGVGHGTTPKPSKQSELASARRILNKPSKS